MSEKEINFFNQLAEQWDALRSANHDKINLLVDMIGIDKGDLLLDVGTGTGVLLPFLKQATGSNGHITAIDFAANMITLAEAKHRHLTGISYVAGDILHFDSQQTFDKIICFNFFPHITDKPVFLTRMKQLLKPGGSLIIMHDLSRQAVNSIHKTSDIVKNDRLPEIGKVSEMLGIADYLVAHALDNADCYFIKATTKLEENTV
ncbi:MAG: ubiE 1 [Sporomusa sp.]|jgi:demethylmenaquinone methyltransferase/2-methoxy-6-polyprenyl-1,4-benzoquinol methylase|nr:ubiE 1 [Sporomusa sp.]